MTVVKSFLAAVVYAFAITSMNEVMRDYDTSSTFMICATCFMSTHLCVCVCVDKI